ncbi:pirin family protein [uncultured Tessaracoccus sp.]|uniref:pirin family protein n=1 Tax=uncultured Tessaracoccus sp. TaxID=905023 RepID=UPI0025EF33A8|nr:pirin family protein [uncultured Tessaracoccus sp.]
MTDVTVITPRIVPLSDQAAMQVRRTLPSRHLSFVGAWCFADHYGPDQVREPADGMDVPPHPHTGLQTVSWLFDGHIEHRDSDGVHAMIEPGEINLMTSGHGIAHSEVSTPETDVLHGVQLWIALPERFRDTARAFQHHAPEERCGEGFTALVFVGELRGVDTSPIVTHTPLLGAELRIDAETTVELDVDPGFEHALIVDAGEATLEGQRLERGELGHVDVGPETLHIAAGATPVRAILLGGAPFDDEIVMWWNFIGPDHEYVVAAREEYEAGSERFGTVEGYEGEIQRLPAPPLPPVRLRARNRTGRIGG